MRESTNNYSNRFHIALSVFLLLAIAYFTFSPALSSAFSSLGGYESELTLGDGVGSFLLLGTGPSGPVVAGSVPVISTSPVAYNGADAATLAGVVSSLNGMPYANVWFEWGTNPLALAHTTATTVIAAAGGQTASIPIDHPGQTIYYRIASSTDATTYGSITSFIAGNGLGQSHTIAVILIPLAIAVATALAAWMARSNPVAMMTAVMSGIMTLIIAEVLLNNLL